MAHWMILEIDVSGRSKGALTARAPADQNFFNFMAFLRKSIKYIGSSPPSKELVPLPTTNAGSAPGYVCEKSG